MFGAAGRIVNAKSGVITVHENTGVPTFLEVWGLYDGVKDGGSPFGSASPTHWNGWEVTACYFDDLSSVIWSFNLALEGAGIVGLGQTGVFTDATPEDGSTYVAADADLYQTDTDRAFWSWTIGEFDRPARWDGAGDSTLTITG